MVSSENGKKIDLDKLFSPNSIAIVGASETRHYSQSLIANLRGHGFNDENIYPINPKYETVSEIKCWKGLDELPSVPDAVAILVGHEQVAGVIELAGDIGISAALVIADGYAEESEEGRAAQIALGAKARDSGIALLGPNTLGYLFPSSGAGMWCAGAVSNPLTYGNISVIAQSSGMLNVVVNMFGDRKVGVRSCVSIGNAELIGLPELVTYFAEDTETNVIALIVESIDRPREFVEAVSLAARNKKPVVVLKIGISERGQQNSLAHTGRLSSPNQGWQAVFERYGVCVTSDLDDFVETVTLFRGLVKIDKLVGEGSSGIGVAFATISGGETSLICDIAEQEHLPLADLSSETLASLRLSLAKSTLIGNPLDLQNSRTSRPDAFWESLKAIASDESVDVLAIRFNFSTAPTEGLKSLYKKVIELANSLSVTPLVLSRAYERLDLSWWTLFRELDTTFVLSYRNSIRALSNFNYWLSTLSKVTDIPKAIPSLPSGEPASKSVSMSLSDAQSWLVSSNLPYVPNGIAKDPTGAGELADGMGYPVVVKAVLPDMVHKSDSGGVVLGLLDRESVVQACNEIASRLSGSQGGESLHFEVQKMIDSGIEVIMGMIKDPTWGPLLMVGSGGIYAEVLRDTVWGLPPVTADGARRMLEKLRIWPLLNGARGKDQSDVGTLSQVVAFFSEAIVRDGDWLESIDLNPVIVGSAGNGAFVVDVSIFREDYE